MLMKRIVTVSKQCSVVLLIILAEIAFKSIKEIYTNANASNQKKWFCRMFGRDYDLKFVCNYSSRTFRRVCRLVNHLNYTLFSAFSVLNVFIEN